jgi:phenylacetate-coenzyme A ligase PaaK-like adenylate-forming protein
VEVGEPIMKDGERLKRLKKELEKELKEATMLRFNVHILPSGSLPRSSGKTRRIIDERENG